MSEDFFIVWRLVFLNILPVSTWELFDTTTFSWFWKTISLFSVANPYPRNIFIYGDHISRDLFKFDPYDVYNNMIGDLTVPILSFNGDSYYSRTFDYHYFFFFCKQLY